MQKYTGGPAFPVDSITQRDSQGYAYGNQVSATGITVRDYFAAKAMAALIVEGGYDSRISDLSDAAYRQADAMLKSRVK